MIFGKTAQEWRHPPQRPSARRHHRQRSGAAPRARPGRRRRVLARGSRPLCGPLRRSMEQRPFPRDRRPPPTDAQRRMDELVARPHALATHGDAEHGAHGLSSPRIARSANMPRKSGKCRTAARMAERAAESCLRARLARGRTLQGRRFCVASRHAEAIRSAFRRERSKRNGCGPARTICSAASSRTSGLASATGCAPTVVGSATRHRFDPDKLLVDPYATCGSTALSLRSRAAAARTGFADCGTALVPKAIVEPNVAREASGANRSRRGWSYEINVRAHTKP